MSCLKKAKHIPERHFCKPPIPENASAEIKTEFDTIWAIHDLALECNRKTLMERSYECFVTEADRYIKSPENFMIGKPETRAYKAYSNVREKEKETLKKLHLQKAKEDKKTNPVKVAKRIQKGIQEYLDPSYLNNTLNSSGSTDVEATSNNVILHAELENLGSKSNPRKL